MATMGIVDWVPEALALLMDLASELFSLASLVQILIVVCSVRIFGLEFSRFFRGGDQKLVGQKIVSAEKNTVGVSATDGMGIVEQHGSAATTRTSAASGSPQGSPETRTSSASGSESYQPDPEYLKILAKVGKQMNSEARQLDSLLEKETNKGMRRQGLTPKNSGQTKGSGGDNSSSKSSIKEGSSLTSDSAETQEKE